MSLKHVIEHYKTPLLILIILFASFLRLYDLGNLPSGFHNDEASFFLNAQALKQTLHDEDNRFLPLYLNSFIDPKPALYSYLQIPFIATLGETHTAARLPAALFGIMSIFLTFLLFRRLLNTQLALLASAVLAISPWHIMLSRASQEVIMSFTFSIAALLMLVIGLHRKEKQIVPYIFFLFFSLLSMYSYHSAKIFLPLESCFIIFYFFFSKQLKLKSFFLLLSGLIIVTLISVGLGGFTRYNAVAIFSSPGVQLLIDEQIRTATGHTTPLFIRIFNNKLVDYTFEFCKQYGEYFSMSYLFTSGGMPTRYVIPFHGLLYLFEALLVLIGIAYGLLTEKFKRITYFFLVWLIIAPIPAALTIQEVPSMIRSFPMIIPLVVFISFGIYAVCVYRYKLIPRVVPPIFLGILYVGGLGYFLYQFCIQQPYYHPWHRYYGAEQLPQSLAPFANSYDEIRIGENQYVYFALAKSISISELQRTYPKRLGESATFRKITFESRPCHVYPTKKKILFVMRGECGDFSKKGYKKVGEVLYKDNNPEYVFYEYIPLKGVQGARSNLVNK